MITPASPNDPKATVAKPHPAENFAEDLQLFWLKNRNAILFGCALVLLGILAKGGYSFYAEQREASIAKEYAAAGSVTAKLKDFAVSHEGHALAGVAYLRIGDESYNDAKYADAQAAYEKAIPSFKGTAFAARATLGIAMSQLMIGKKAEAQIALKRLSDDAGQFKGLRAEACYHLISLAMEDGKTEDARKLIDQLLQVDRTGVWAQRALLIRAALPASAPEAGLKVGAPTK